MSAVLVDKMMELAERAGKASGHLGVLREAAEALAEATECALPRPLINGPIDSATRDAWNEAKRVRFLLDYIERDLAAHAADLARRAEAAGLATADQSEGEKR